MPDDIQDYKYFQIKEENSENALTRSSGADLVFQPNELKDSQFWYMLQNHDEQHGFGDFGFIGSKQYFAKNQVLTTGM